jgi:thioredoxin reductase
MAEHDSHAVALWSILLGTSRRGAFAAGDVRSGSNKRVASAVGEGARAVQFGHEYFKEK